MKTVYNSDSLRFVAIIASLACVVKFLFEGVIIHLGAHTFDFGHADSLTYGALLAPILGAHGYMQTKKPKTVTIEEGGETK